MKLLGLVLSLAFAVTIMQFDSYKGSSLRNQTVLANIGGTGNHDEAVCGSGGSNPPDAKPDDAKPDGADHEWPCV